ncbi:Mlo-related protein - like 10 [Theobroma cacao]|nr:Mlo-related protein - like 10 [Theobroma cacao]WRX32925.1 Mlo-related protein - like 10 [Theobroma cacao]
MAAGEGAASTRTLQQTPTWAVATVCFVFIALSILIEHLIHLISKWLKGHKKTALFEAVEKLKSVLMVLGFMSLILTVAQSSLSKICIPNKLANTMLPCHKSQSTKTTKAIGYDQIWSHQLHERTLAVDASESSSYCDSKGMTSLISQDGANQLSIFLFVLAAMQIVYSVVTMALGRAKMRRWKAWEKETQTVEYQAANDPNRFRFTRQTTFARRHMNSCAETSILLWIKCFFQQFFSSVAKVDYLTLRHGFISFIHESPNIAIYESLGSAGSRNQAPAKMAHQVKDQNSVIQGAPLVQPNDNFFWLSQPKLFLTLLHYTLFMNAFEAAFFVWVTSQYGIKSCYHEHPGIIATRMMGSNFKSALFEEHTANAIRQWHAGVKQKRKNQGGASRVGNDNSNSNRSISSDLSTQHRAPTSSEIASFPSRTEIVEEDTEIQEEAADPAVNKIPTVVDIEMPSTGKSLANQTTVKTPDGLPFDHNKRPNVSKIN